MPVSRYLKYVYIKYYIYYSHILAILDVYIILQNTKELIFALCVSLITYLYFYFYFDMC